MDIEFDFNDISDGSINNTDASNIIWEGNGIFDKLMMVINGNIKVQYDSGRITGSDFANVYLGSLNTTISESMKFLMNKASILKNLEAQDVQIAIGEVQLAESSEKWGIQKQILENQLEMSNVDVAYKEQNVLRDLEIRDKQIESASADIEFNVAKKLIMEQTRNDNIRSKAAEQFAEFIKYLSAANVVPGTDDFKNMRKLIIAMNSGISDSDAVATINETSSSDYVVIPKTTTP